MTQTNKNARSRKQRLCEWLDRLVEHTDRKMSLAKFHRHLENLPINCTLNKKEVLYELHRQFSSNFRHDALEQISKLIEQSEVGQRLDELDEYMADAKRSNPTRQRCWRPTGTPTDDTRVFHYNALLRYKSDLLDAKQLLEKRLNEQNVDLAERRRCLGELFQLSLQNSRQLSEMIRALKIEPSMEMEKSSNDLTE